MTPEKTALEVQGDHDFSLSPTDQMNVHKFLVNREAVRKSGIPLHRIVNKLISFPFSLHRFVFSYPVSGKYLQTNSCKRFTETQKKTDQYTCFHGKTSGPTSKLGTLIVHDFSLPFTKFLTGSCSP